MKKLVALLLILMLVLVACGGGGDDEEDSTTTDTDTTEQTDTTDTEETTDTEDTEEADSGDDADEEATEETTEEADAGDDADDAEATEESDSGDDADAGDEDSAEEPDATEEADSGDDADEESAGGGEPVVIEGYQTYESDCPFRLDLQYPPDWTLRQAVANRMTFDRALESGDTQEIVLEYRGSNAQNQVPTLLERFANAPTAQVVGQISPDGDPLDVYREDREIQGNQVVWYNFLLPSERLVDSLRLAVTGVGDDGNFLDDAVVIEMLTTAVSNRCS